MSQGKEAMPIRIYLGLFQRLYFVHLKSVVHLKGLTRFFNMRTALSILFILRQVGCGAINFFLFFVGRTEALEPLKINPQVIPFLGFK